MTGLPGGRVESWVGRHPLRRNAAAPGFEPATQFGRPSRFGGRAVGRFAGVVAGVEKFEPTVLEVFDELPVAQPDRAGRPPPLVRVVGLVPEERAIVAGRQDGVVGEIAEVGRLRHRDPGQAADRRHEVAGGDRRRHHAPGLGPAGKAHDQRHPHATVVEESLAGPERGIERRRWIPDLRHMEAAVVGGEGDERGVGDTGVVERREDLPHRVVERRNKSGVGRVERAGVRCQARRRGRQGNMRRVEADDEEERLVVVVADLLGDDPHRVGGLPLLPLCPLRRFSPGVGRPAGRRGKAPVGRQGPLAPEVPLADEMTAVAGRRQPLGKRGDRRRQCLFDHGGEEFVARPV